MTTKRCATVTNIRTKGDPTAVETLCTRQAVGAIYIDGRGWKPICDAHLRTVLNALGPVVIRSA